MPHAFLDLARPIPIGHRGAAGEMPENTLPSFAHALDLGAGILETDVHLTSDGHVVVHHDDRVDRTTDGEGPLADMDLSQLQALDAGFRFTPDEGRSHPHRGAGIRIPTLAEAFEAFPDARFNIELKAAAPQLVERTLDLVMGRAERTLLAAADPQVMENLRAAVKRRGVDVAIGASAADVLGFVRSALDGSPPPQGPMALQVPADFGGRPLVTPEFVAHAHAHGLHVHVWTINEPDEIERLLELGVDGLVSDFPGRVVAAAKRRGAG
jgi:glycerophosphoryl diester phosphodiesterase